MGSLLRNIQLAVKFNAGTLARLVMTNGFKKVRNRVRRRKGEK